MRKFSLHFDKSSEPRKFCTTELSLFNHTIDLFLLLYDIIPDTLKSSRSSLLLEVNQIFNCIKDKFSEVLLSVENISKQGLLGKGYTV